MTGRRMLTVHGDTDVDVPALPTPTPGLWVGEYDEPRAGRVYHVIHASSGACAAVRFASPEAALAAAVEFGALLDWSQPAYAVQVALDADPGLVRARNDIARHYGGSTYGEPVSPEVLATWEQVST